jgi:hypothetical protein
MNISLPNGASGFYPASSNHILGDPTPLDQAVYIPSVAPGFAMAAYDAKWERDLPSGVGPNDLNFLDPANPLFRISHVMSSAGLAYKQKRPCIVTQRDRTQTLLICDSGGYQIASGNLPLSSDQDRLDILRWLELNADWAMTLDVPTGPLLKTGYKYSSFQACLNQTLDHLEFFQKHRKPGATKFLNVLQGNTTQQTDKWYEAVKHYEFEGWAFAGLLRHNFYNLCRRIIKMADDGLLQSRDWIHVLGTNELETAVGLTALQRAINRHINPRLRISYDTSTPFRLLRWQSLFQTMRFDRKGMTLPTTDIPDGRHLVNSRVRFPWPSPLGDRMTLGDLCVKQGANKRHYRDAQSDLYVGHHNLAALCYAVASANRIFDSESLLGTHTISTDMGRAVAAIDKVIKVGRLTELERHRSTFNAVRTIKEDADEDREQIDVI